MAEPQTGTPQEKTGEKSPDELSKEELDKATGGARIPNLNEVLRVDDTSKIITEEKT